MATETQHTLPDTRYYRAVGRRKTATARVRLYEADEQQVIINNKAGDAYFPTELLYLTARSPIDLIKPDQPFVISVKTRGGGLSAQAEAIRLGIARALLDYNEEYRDGLKKAGYLKRDPRAKERKKPGKKKARKSEQWSKR